MEVKLYELGRSYINEKEAIQDAAYLRHHRHHHPACGPADLDHPGRLLHPLRERSRHQGHRPQRFQLH